MRAFVVLGLFFYRTKQRDSPRKRLRNDLFCVEWDVKPQLNQARSKIVTGHFADTARVVCGAGQSLKNVPGGTDVLGKWKSVPGKIRIRASIWIVRPSTVHCDNTKNKNSIVLEH